MRLTVTLPLASFFERVARSLETIRERRGLLPCVLACGAILLVCAGIYVRPSLPVFPDNLVGGARFYEVLAADPLAFDTLVSFRVLVPLLAHVVGLGAERLPYFNLILVYAVICVIFFHYLKRYEDALLPFAITAAMSLTMPVLYGVYDLWALETGRVLCVMLMVMARNRQPVFWALFAVSLFVHDGDVFLLPFLVLLQFALRKSLASFLIGTGLGVGIALGLYLPFNWLIGERLVALGVGSMDAASRLSLFFNDPLSYMRFGLWSAYDSVFATYKLFWLVIAAGVYYAFRAGDRLWALVIAAAPASAALQFISGAELFRYLVIGFPGLIFSIEVLAQRFGHRLVAQVILHLTLVNLFVPQQLVWGNAIGKMQNLFHMLMFWTF